MLIVIVHLKERYNGKREIDEKITFPGTTTLIPVILLANKMDECKNTENKYGGKTCSELCKNMYG